MPRLPFLRVCFGRTVTVVRCAPLVAALVTGMAAVGPQAAHALDAAAIERCKEVADPGARLTCYDKASGRTAPAEDTSPQARALLTDSPRPQAAEKSMFGDRWGLGVSPSDSRFDTRAHRPSYLLMGRYSDTPNRLPNSPSKPPFSEPFDVQPIEAKFQLSFKFKVADFSREMGMPLGIWAGYTQQSQWQVYNVGLSRPFRETNYEPELMVALHPDREWLGWRWRLAALGINHQSNGRSEPLSRSWNRVVAQFGVERGNVALILRPWVRLREDGATDDNPDLTRYLGHGDATLVWAPGRHQFSLASRFNPGSGYGAVQAHWTFPIARRLRGIVQVFSGYGESLIDYNVRQTTFGVGISLADHL